MFPEGCETKVSQLHRGGDNAAADVCRPWDVPSFYMTPLRRTEMRTAAAFRCSASNLVYDVPILAMAKSARALGPDNASLPENNQSQPPVGDISPARQLVKQLHDQAK